MRYPLRGSRELRFTPYAVSMVSEDGPYKACTYYIYTCMCVCKVVGEGQARTRTYVCARRGEGTSVCVFVHGPSVSMVSEDGPY